MTNIADIMDVDQLERLVEEKYINRVLSPDRLLTLYNYSPRAMYEQLWTPETKQCRGLVVDTATGTIVARCWEKFFCLNEYNAPECSFKAILNRPGHVEVTEKIDGSMVLVWWNPHTKDWCCSTRGRFDSTQAIAAKQWLTDRMTDAPWGWTYICEWRSPENKGDIVLRHKGEPELRLLGMRSHNGIDFPHEAVQTWGYHLGLPVVNTVYCHSLQVLADRCETTTGTEGWVVRWSDGFRVKFKTAEWMRLHKAMVGFSPARVLDAMLGGHIDRYIRGLPEEIRTDAESMRTHIECEAQTQASQMQVRYERIQHRLAESRKAYAQAVMQENASDRSYLFMLADGKPIRNKILKNLDLFALFGESEVAECPIS